MNKIIWSMLLGFLGGTVGQNDIIIPVLHMPFVNTETYRSWSTSSASELGKKFTAIHMVEKEPSNYNIGKLYSMRINNVGNYIQSEYIIVGSPPPASSLSNINYYWSTNISRDDIKGTSLEGYNLATDYTFGAVQEMMLTNISRKMSIELSKVAVRLGVPTRDLSYAYDPAKWDELVHAMVAEGIVSYVSLLELGSKDRLADLVSPTLIQLKKVTIDGFLSLLPPFLPKKAWLDENKTSEVLTFTGISSSSAEALIYKLVNLTTRLTVEQFGILYNLTLDQQRAAERSTLLQVSQACRISMSVLLDKTIPSIVWNTLGNMATSTPCPNMLKVKGPLISSFSLTNVQQMTVLQILLGICNLYWKSCRLTMTLEPSEWECFDSATLLEAATILSTTDATLQGKPIHNLVLGMSQKCKDGSHSLTAYRQKTSNSLQTLFNLTASQLQTLLGIEAGPYAAYTSAQLVEAYLNASSMDLGIPLSTMFNTTSKTLQELYNSPTSELHEIIPFILRSAIKSPASELQVSDAHTFTLLGLFPDNSTIAELKFAIQNVLPPILPSKNKFDNETLSVYLTANSITDEMFGGNSTLAVLLAASGFDTRTVKIIYRLTEEQLRVMSLLNIKELQRYCGFDLTTLKQLPPYNITTALVGIQNEQATCKATRFFVAAKSQKVFDHEATCSVLSSTSTSLMRIVEQCSGLTWRFNAKMFEEAMSDWPQMDALNKASMPTLSSLSIDTFQQNTLEYLLKKANTIHSDYSSVYQIVLRAYSIQTLTVLLTTFSTSKAEVTQTLSIRQAAFDAMTILSQVEKVQEFLKKKYTITFASIAPVLDVTLSNIKYLAPTEWQEMLLPLKQEIVASGSSQLSVTQDNFIILLKLSSNISSSTLAQLEVSWDRQFGRLLSGKKSSENQTIGALQQLMNISQESLNGMTLLTFYKMHLNLTKDEISILFKASPQALEVLNEFYFSEIPCSCGFSESSLKSKTPYQLLTAMIGQNDVSSCRNIALLVAFRLLNIHQVSAKFNIQLNETTPLLTNIENFVNLPFEKIAWGLKVQGSDWPLVDAVSLDHLANVTSTSVQQMRNLSMANVTEKIVMNKRHFTSQLNALHNTLLVQASSVFALTASETCGQCSIPTSDILKTFLNHLGGITYVDPQNLSFVTGYECIKHDNMLLLPSKWSMLVPHIIPKSFTNISTLLGITEQQLAGIHALPKGEIMNMTLIQYIDITKSRIHPLFKCRETMKNDIVLTKSQATGVSVSVIGKQNVLQILMMMCSDVSISNMSLVMGWGPNNMTVLGNYTMEDAALCKRTPVTNVLSRTLMALVTMILNEVHGCVIVPCRSGTVLDYQKLRCKDINECNSTAAPKCQNNQICQNYFGGYECDCVKPGTSLEGKLCDRTKHYQIKIRIVNRAFNEKLKLIYTREYYELKENLQNNINKVYLNTLVFKIHYKGCKVNSFSDGSVVADVSVYTSLEYTGTLGDLELYFKDGLNNTNGKTYLNDLEIDKNAMKASDYDECSNNANDCHTESTCSNEEGSFSCTCKSGYDGDGVTCTEASFLVRYWWLMIIFAALFLITLIILIVVLLIKKLKPSVRSGSRSSVVTENVELRDYENVHQMEATSASMAARSRSPDINLHQREDESTENVGNSLESPAGVSQGHSAMQPQELQPQYYQNLKRGTTQPQYYQNLKRGTTQPQELQPQYYQNLKRGTTQPQELQPQYYQNLKRGTTQPQYYQNLKIGTTQPQELQPQYYQDLNRGTTQPQELQTQHYLDLKRGTTQPQVLYEHLNQRSKVNKEFISESEPYEPLQTNTPGTEYQSLTGYLSTDSKV